MKPTIRIKFRIRSRVHMTPQIFFNKMPYMFEHFNLVSDDKNPDYVVYVGRMPKGNYQRIWYTHENVRPPMDMCEWALSFDYPHTVKNPRHFRMPNYVRLGAGPDLLQTGKEKIKKLMKQKTKFCTFVYSHDVPVRNKFFNVLSSYKKVDAPGRCCHNAPVIGSHKSAMASKSSSSFNAEKLKYYKPYKFVIAFENAIYPGYTTEKIYHALAAGCIPIYWGSKQVGRDFNTKRFINAHDIPHKNANAMMAYLRKRVIALDKNQKLYEKMLSEPCYPNNQMPEWVDPEKVVEFFKQVFGKHNARKDQS